MSHPPTWNELDEREHALGPSPGVRERWRRGRQRYAVWGLRVLDPAVTARLRAAQRALAPWIHPVAEPHLTLWVAGFPARRPRWDDDIAWALLRAQRRALLCAGLGRPGRGLPTLTVGGLGAFASCAVLGVQDPAGWLGAARAALATVGGEQRFAPYRPHLTVGLWTQSWPTAPLRAAITPLAHAPPLALGPAALELWMLDARREDAPLRRRWRILPGTRGAHG